MSKNKNLNKANKEKNDEFYTRLDDINREVSYYENHFKGKTVFCNCDDPEWSNFYKFFELKFDVLGIKRLITTHYTGNESNSYKLEIYRNQNNEIIKRKIGLIGNGDFRNEESIDSLKEADIVITNPPFSLFREYIAQLMEYEKKFLIIGNHNAVTYKDIFEYVKDNKIWIGVSPRSMSFILPDKTLSSVNASWFTNLSHKKRNDEMILVEKYKGNETKYPKYDNYDAIEVSKTNDIPMDYDGAMGVPITFLDKYNPEQFEILGLDDHRVKYPRMAGCNSINGKEIYRRIIIKNKKIKG